MGAERNDVFVPHAVLFQKREERHGHSPPPVREADEDSMILVPIGDFGGNLRAGIALLFLLSHIHHGVIILRIRHDGLEFDHIPSHAPMNLPGEPPRIAGMGKIKNQHLVPSCFRSISGRPGQYRSGDYGGGAKRDAFQKASPRPDHVFLMRNGSVGLQKDPAGLVHGIFSCNALKMFILPAWAQG